MQTSNKGCAERGGGVNKGLAKEEEVENMCGVDGTERDSTKLLQPSFFTQGVLNKLTVNLVRVKRVKSCCTQCSIHFLKKTKSPLHLCYHAYVCQIMQKKSHFQIKGAILVNLKLSNRLRLYHLARLASAAAAV